MISEVNYRIIILFLKKKSAQVIYIGGYQQVSVIQMHSQELTEELLTHRMGLRYLGGDINLVRWSRRLMLFYGGSLCTVSV